MRGWKSKEQLSLKAKMPYSSGGWPFFEGPDIVHLQKSPWFMGPEQRERHVCGRVDDLLWLTD